MNKHIISTMAIMSLIISLALASTAVATHMPSGNQQVEGALKSQSLLEGDDGQEYMLYNIPRGSQMYIGQEVVIQGFLTDSGSQMDQKHKIRVDNLVVAY